VEYVLKLASLLIAAYTFASLLLLNSAALLSSVMAATWLWLLGCVKCGQMPGATHPFVLCSQTQQDAIDVLVCPDGWGTQEVTPVVIEPAGLMSGGGGLHRTMLLVARP